MSLFTKLFGLSKKEKQELVQLIAQGFKGAIKELDPDKRYLLLVPHDLSDEELKKFKDLLYKGLDLANNQNFKIAYIQAKGIKLLEF